MSKIVDSDATAIIRCCCRRRGGSSARRIVRSLRRSLPWIQKTVPLQTLGICRRCRHKLYKLKADLQNLGLSRRQVQQGLVQLATRTRVVLTRQPMSRRYGCRPRRLFVEDDEEESSKTPTNCISAADHEYNLQQKGKDAQKCDSTEISALKEAERNETSTCLQSADTREPVISSKRYFLGSNGTVLHPFDKAFEQLDKTVITKMNTLKKSINKKRHSVIVSADTTCKVQKKEGVSNKGSPLSKKAKYNENENHGTQVEDTNNEAKRKTPDLVSDKVGATIVHTPSKDKRRQIKLNLSSSCKSSSTKADIVKPNVNKRVDSNGKTAISSEADYSSTKIRYSPRENDRSKVVSPVSEDDRTERVGTKVANKESSAQKKRVHEGLNSGYTHKKKKLSEPFNKVEKGNKEKKKRIKRRFRKYFGECTSLSEHEEEEDILGRRFKRRRKMDSVDSCDSGVCTAESNASNCVEILREFQKAVPDSTVQEEFGEDTEKTSSETEVLAEVRNVTTNEIIEIIEIIENVETTNKIKGLKAVAKAEKVTSVSEQSDSEVESMENIRRHIEAGGIGSTENEHVQSAENTTNVEVVELAGDGTEARSMESTEKSEKTPSNTCEICTPSKTECDQIVTQNEIQEKLVDISDRSSSADIGSTTDTASSPEADRSDVDVPAAEVQTGTTANTVDVQGTATGKSKYWENIIDYSPDLGDLLRLAFDGTCQITSNGNVISIQENVEDSKNGDTSKEDIDENSNVKVATEPQSVSDQNFRHKEGERDASNVTNKSVLPESEQSSVAEKKDAQPKEVPLPKLRVLSSAELGSRWCPTPMNPPPCTVSSQSSYNMTAVPNSVSKTSTTVSTTTTAPVLMNILTQTVPAVPVVQTVPAPPVVQPVPAPPVVQTVPAPPVVPTPAATPTSKEETMYSKNPELSAGLLRIHELIIIVRTAVPPSLTELDRLLTWEFTKLYKTLKVDYTTIMQKVTNKFNETFFPARLLSFEELFLYAPSLKWLCLTEVTNKFLSKAPSNQTTYQNFQSMHSTPAQAEAQNSASSVPAAQAQCLLNQTPVSISFAPPPYQEKVVLQSQNNVPQNCAPPNISSNPLLKIQQLTHRMEMQRQSQQKPPPAYVSKPRLMYIDQRGIGEHVYLSSVATDQSRKQVYVPATNVSFMNQQYMQQVHVTQASAHMANPVQQNVNPVQQNFTQLNQQRNGFLAQLLQQRNVNSASINEQQNVHLGQRVQQQHINPAYLAQPLNMPPLQKIQPQYIHPAHVAQQQNIQSMHATRQRSTNPASKVQQPNMNHMPRAQQPNTNSMPKVQQNINPAQRVQQQTMNPVERVQQQNINPAQRVQQQTTNPAQRMQQQTTSPVEKVQQQNIDPAQRVQQQTMNSAERMQQQTVNPAERIQQNINSAQRVQQQTMNPIQRVQQTMNPTQRVQQQNINTAQRTQQPSINVAYVPQQQTINPTVGIQQQNINPASQEFQKTTSGKFTYDMTQGTAQSPSTPQSVPVIKYRLPKKAQQNEQTRQKMVPQMKGKVSTNVPEQAVPPLRHTQTAPSSEPEQSTSPERKHEDTSPISLESTMGHFNILKSLSAIQKLMLKDQLAFYFNCTTWLEQPFPAEEWNKTVSERLLLLNFQTILKHIVEKTVKDLQSKCQVNTTEGSMDVKNVMDIKIGIPNQLYIIVEESSGVHCQIKVSTTEQTKGETINIGQRDETRQDSADTVQKQPEKQKEVTDDLQNAQSADETHQSKIDLPKEETEETEQNKETVENDKQKEATVESNTDFDDVIILEPETSKNHENEEVKVENNSENSTNSCNVNTEENVLSTSEDSVENTARTTPKVVAASDSKESNKEAIQLQATQLVTVEISPNNDQVKVIDVNATRETEDDTVIKIGTDSPEESEQKPQEEIHSRCISPKLEEITGCEASAESIFDSSDDDIKYLNYAHTNSALSDESIETHIADVRTISLEAFEKIEDDYKHFSSTTEENEEEEEIKICLRCNKPSTVVCSNCLEAKYCSKECSHLHWHDEHHKNCKPVEKSLYL